MVNTTVFCMIALQPFTVYIDTDIDMLNTYGTWCYFILLSAYLWGMKQHLSHCHKRKILYVLFK